MIEFPFGLIGLGGLRYALLDRNPGTGFLWLHSVDEPALALPVVSPHQFFPDVLAADRPRGSQAHGDRGRDRRTAVRDGARHAEPARHHRQPARPAADPGRPRLPGAQHVDAPLQAPLFSSQPAAAVGTVDAAWAPRTRLRPEIAS